METSKKQHGSLFIRYKKLLDFFLKLFIFYLLLLITGFVLDYFLPGSFSTYNFLIGAGWFLLGSALMLSLFGRRPTMMETVHWRRETVDHFTIDYWRSRGGLIVVAGCFIGLGLFMVLLSLSTIKEYQVLD